MRGPSEPPGLLVVGAPRSGFSLLISVLTECRVRSGELASRRQRALRAMESELGRIVADRIDAALDASGCRGGVVFNDNFRRLVGGPRWLDERDSNRVCFRKYIGVRGAGDFTLVTSHPAALLEVDQVVHSHSGAAAWPILPTFAGRLRFASVRNPFGVLNSSVFSINALASEYLGQTQPPAHDAEPLRQRLGAYKLTDLRFFRSLAQHLRRELDAYLPQRSRYHEMRWEDLITDPVPTIRRLAERAQTPVSARLAETIWRDLGHRNLTGAHRHNYRQGYGKVGNWRSWLIDAHLEVAREVGLTPAIEALGYRSDEQIDAATYTPFQRDVAAAVQAGRVLDDVADRDLFTFAFNKTNIDFAEFGFRSGEWRVHTRMERSCMRDPGVETGVAEAAEQACGALNAFLHDFLALDFDAADATACAEDVFASHAEPLAKLGPQRFAAARAGVREALRPPRRSWLRGLRALRA